MKWTNELAYTMVICYGQHFREMRGSSVNMSECIRSEIFSGRDGELKASLK